MPTIINFLNLIPFFQVLLKIPCAPTVSGPELEGSIFWNQVFIHKSAIATLMSNYRGIAK